MFKPNFNKHKFTIIIDVYENATIANFKSSEGHVPGYQETIGALNCIQFGIMKKQGEQNKKAFDKLIEKQKKREKDNLQ